jgi:hypothetical protein
MQTSTAQSLRVTGIASTAERTRGTNIGSSSKQWKAKRNRLKK